MRRGYTREVYLDLIKRAREMIPGVALSSDFISGFCGETEDEHAETLSLLEDVRYEQAFMFHYSLREKTHAARNLEDDRSRRCEKTEACGSHRDVPSSRARGERRGSRSDALGARRRREQEGSEAQDERAIGHRQARRHTRQARV